MARMSIFEEASHLKKKYPGKKKTWQEYIQWARKIYQSKYGEYPPPHKKKTMHKRRRTVKKKKSRRIGQGQTTKSRTHTDYNRNKVNISVGAISHHKKMARVKLEHLIGQEEVKRFKATKVRIRKKIGKKIARLKQDWRRLSA